MEDKEQLMTKYRKVKNGRERLELPFYIIVFVNFITLTPLWIVIHFVPKTYTIYKISENLLKSHLINSLSLLDFIITTILSLILDGLLLEEISLKKQLGMKDG